MSNQKKISSSVYNVDRSLVFKGVSAAMLRKPSLDFLEGISVSCLLWKAIYKLGIIQNLLPEPRTVWSENYLSLPVRMTTLQRITLPEDREPDHVLLLKQVQKSRFFLENVLEETIYELSYRGSCCFLEYVLCCHNLLNFDNIMLKKDHIDLNHAIRLLKEKLIVVRENFEKTVLYFSEMTGPCLENAVVNALAQAETLIMRTEYNQLARIDQNKYRVKQKENSAITGLENINQEIEEGIEISNEIDSHILFMTLKLQVKLDKWTMRYNNEIENLDIALLQLKSKLDEQKDQYQKLLQQYTEKKEHLEILQEEADIRDREMALKIVQNKAATVIQEWWRVILFRRLIKKRMAIKAGTFKAGKKDKTKNNQSKKKKRK